MELYEPYSNRIREIKKGIEVWMEGYAATGQHGCAQLLGIYDVPTFDEAVEMYNRPSFIRKTPAEKGMDGVWRIWGCRLFDNEIEAKESFG